MHAPSENRVGEERRPVDSTGMKALKELLDATIRRVDALEAKLFSHLYEGDTE